jgi:SAM-dependent methyltransferase
MTDTDLAPQVAYYGRDRYWNELTAVIGHLARLSTGSEEGWWTRYIKQCYCKTPCRRALVIGCGNGWVERAIFDEGLAKEIDAFDVDPAYVKLARKDRGDRNINYFVSDFRSFRASHEYDLIINHAALHHAKWLYRHCRALANALAQDGIFVTWDYIGPDRNQYDERHIAQLAQYNNCMPERFRTRWNLRPSLRLALEADPTEAVHATEIVRALENEFEIIERHDLGGGLAYPLLWNNIAEFEREDDEARGILASLLAEDDEATQSGRVPNLFTFIIARPRTHRRSVRAAADIYIREPIRETIAERAGNIYAYEVTRTFRRYQLWRPRGLAKYLRQRRSYVRGITTAPSADSPTGKP